MTVPPAHGSSARVDVDGDTSDARFAPNVPLQSRDRAVSTVLGYVLTLGITAILVGGLMMAGGQFVGDQRERVVRSELGVVAERFATDLESADRLAAMDGTDAVEVESRLPARLGGVRYAVTITDEDVRTDQPNTYTIEVTTRSDRLSETVSTTIGLESQLVTDTHRGGDLAIVLTGTGPLTLEVQDG